MDVFSGLNWCPRLHRLCGGRTNFSLPRRISVLDTSAWLRSTIWSGLQQNALWHVLNAPPTGQTPLAKKYAHLATLIERPWSSKRGPSLFFDGRVHGQQNVVFLTLAQNLPASPPLQDSITSIVSALMAPH